METGLGIIYRSCLCEILIPGFFEEDGMCTSSEVTYDLVRVSLVDSIHIQAGPNRNGSNG